MDNNVYPNGEQLERPLGLGEWLITIIVLAIPCVGLIMMFVWGFGQGGNIGRRNYCRASLIISAAGIVLGIILYASLGALLFNAFNSF